MIETLTVMEKETKLVDNEISVIIMLEKIFLILYNFGSKKQIIDFNKSQRGENSE